MIGASALKREAQRQEDVRRVWSLVCRVQAGGGKCVCGEASWRGEAMERKRKHKSCRQ